MGRRKESVYRVINRIPLTCKNPALGRSVKVSISKPTTQEDIDNENDMIYYLNLGHGGSYKISKELYELIIKKHGEQE